MYKIKNNIENTIIINKSKFITSLFVVKDEKEIDDILKDINKKYYDATHNTYAYSIANMQKQKSSDDGEPQGTAGKPMLDVLIKNELTDVLVVVTRYFGGIKLGASGLTRAYANSVSEALNLVEKEKIVEKNVYSITISYPTYNRIQDLFNDLKIYRQSFGSEINMVIGIPKEQDKYLIEQIKNLTLGKVIIDFLYEDNN